MEPARLNGSIRGAVFFESGRQKQAKSGKIALFATFCHILQHFGNFLGNSGHWNTPHADRSNHRCLENWRKITKNYSKNLIFGPQKSLF